jgi:hypothetical protein
MGDSIDSLSISTDQMSGRESTFKIGRLVRVKRIKSPYMHIILYTKISHLSCRVKNSLLVPRVNVLVFDIFQATLR